MKNEYNSIPKEKFEFASQENIRFDQKFETKPIGYFKDAIMRFTKNKGSVVAGVILLLLIAFAVFAPVISSYGVNEQYTQYQYLLPKNKMFEGTGFWDGTKVKDASFKEYVYDNSHGAVVEVFEEYEQSNPTPMKYYKYRFDTYKRGFLYVTLEASAYQKLVQYENDNGIQLRYPMLDTSYTTNARLLLMHKEANYYYQLLPDMTPIFDNEGNIIPIYKVDDITGEYIYEEVTSTSVYRLRVDYDQYYVFQYGKEPLYLFGSDSFGRDIFARLGSGARLSIALGFSVALINILIGVIYGAIEGYYGGTADLIMERIADILIEIPSIILLTLFQIHFAGKIGPIPALLFAFVLTGWISTAARVRMQFYRFKRQEYVLAARTLGASDGRIIFRHILPNAIGTIITGSILMVPSVIFSESILSYLGIVDLTASDITSIGAMLNAGQTSLQYAPHVIFFPAIFISLLMISFNVFGNGLRDAFNPSLRGVEE